MKTTSYKISLCLLALLLSLSAVAQTEGVSIKTTASAPDKTAMLDIESTTRGLLIPRTTLGSITTPLVAGITPANSLIVYNISGSLPVGYYYWTTSPAQWNKISTAPDLWSKIGITNHIQYTNGNVAIGSVVPTSTMASLEINTTNAYAFRFKIPRAELFLGNSNVFSGLISDLVQKSGFDGGGNNLGIRYSQTRGNATGTRERGMEISTSMLAPSDNTGYVSIDAFYNELYIGGKQNIIFFPYGTSLLGPNGAFHYTSCDPIDGHFVTSSDSVLKTNIVTLEPVLSKVMALRPVKYNWKNQLTSRKSIGVIAQETNLVFPELVSESTIANPNDASVPKRTLKSVDYSGFTPILIKAIQEQQVQIETLKARLTALENK